MSAAAISFLSGERSQLSAFFTCAAMRFPDHNSLFLRMKALVFEAAGFWC
jgi:hypothetical protein